MLKFYLPENFNTTNLYKNYIQKYEFDKKNANKMYIFDTTIFFIDKIHLS